MKLNKKISSVIEVLVVSHSQFRNFELLHVVDSFPFGAFDSNLLVAYVFHVELESCKSFYQRDFLSNIQIVVYSFVDSVFYNSHDHNQVS